MDHYPIPDPSALSDRLSTAEVARLLAVSKRQVRRLAAERGWPRMTRTTGRPWTTYDRQDVAAEMSARQPDLMQVGPSSSVTVRPDVRPAPPAELSAALAELAAELRAMRHRAETSAQERAARRRDRNHALVAGVALVACACAAGAVLVAVVLSDPAAVIRFALRLLV
jgi:hypothetical protein